MNEGLTKRWSQRLSGRKFTSDDFNIQLRSNARCRQAWLSLFSLDVMSVARWLLVFVPCALFAQDEENTQLAATAEALPPQVETVATGGYWSRDHQDGSFRLVIESVGWEELGSRAFLQWIRLNHDKQAEIVERTIAIKEIAGRWRVVSQKFVLRGKQCDIIISAERRVPGAKATFTITPSADFSYAITTSEK